MNITSTKQQQTLTYKKPIIERKPIGKKPVHEFNQSAAPKEPYVATPDDPFATGDHTVWANLPQKNADGSPVMVETTETLDLTPRSPWKYGGIAGGVGAVVGAGAGSSSFKPCRGSSGAGRGGWRCSGRRRGRWSGGLVRLWRENEVGLG